MITCCSAVIAFALGYPLHISLLRVHSSKDHVYSAEFWGVLVAALTVIQWKWTKERQSWWRPLLRGVVVGYGSSLIGYTALVIAVGRVQNLRTSSDSLYVLLFPMVAFGWLMEGVLRCSPMHWTGAFLGRLQVAALTIGPQHGLIPQIPADSSF